MSDYSERPWDQRHWDEIHLKEAEEFLLEFLTATPISPTEVIEAGKKKGISASSLRMRWWTLRGRGELDFTSDYKLFRTDPNEVFQQPSQETTNMLKWEYKREGISLSKLEEILNTAGKEGWEVIVVLPDEMGVADVIYKRPIIEKHGS